MPNTIVEKPLIASQWYIYLPSKPAVTIHYILGLLPSACAAHAQVHSGNNAENGVQQARWLHLVAQKHHLDNHHGLLTPHAPS